MRQYHIERNHMYSEILILAMLRSGPRHGYEIKKEVDHALGGTVTLNNKTLYVNLKHFEEMGAVIQEGKPNRHLYQLTDRGTELLQAYLRDFPAAQAGNDAEFLTRVAFFDELEVAERMAILQRRLTFLDGCLSYLKSMRQLADTEDSGATPGASLTPAQRVLTFQTRRFGEEHAWIAEWLEELQAG
jgi:DNA-binding PadR family transcriptional regulator